MIRSWFRFIWVKAVLDRCHPWVVATVVVAMGGAVSARKGDWNDAVEQLKKASHVHKTLPYMEPENWYLPVPLCVGEALIRAGRLDEALNVFRSELENARPNDAWARQGERRALKRLETEKDSGAIISDEEKKRATACFEVFP